MTLSSVYSVITPLLVLGVQAANYKEVERIYVTSGTCYISELTVKCTICHIIYILPPDNWLLIHPKEVITQTEEKQCIVLVIVHTIQDARSA
jgi:hypothetical protein